MKLLNIYFLLNSELWNVGIFENFTPNLLKPEQGL